MSENGIAWLPTKQARQLAKLQLAETKRQQAGTAGYREARYLDITELPTVYDGDDVLDNPNTGGLQQGRPWRTTPLVSYAVAPRASSINEGLSNGTVFDITTTGVPTNTVLYYTVIGTVSGADFTGGTLPSGNFTINDGAGTVSFGLLDDTLTEGAENYQMQIRTGSTSGPVVATSGLVTVNDTSLSPTYALATAGSVTSVNEGTALTFNVTTTNVADGTTLYFYLGSTGAYGITAGRFSQGSGSSFTVTGNSGTFSITVSADSTTATGTQSYDVQLSTTFSPPTFVGSAVGVTVNDTSQTPANGLSVDWYGTTSRIVPTGSYTTPQAGAVTLPAGSYVNVGQNLQSTTFTVTVDANLNSAGSPWVVLWGNDSYTAQTGYVLYWNSTTNASLGIWQARFINSTTPNITTAGRRVYTSVVDGLNVAFYVNGTLINSGTLTGSATTIPNNNFLIGARHSNSGTLLPSNNLDNKGGIYYSAKVQGTALTAAQVVNEYALMPGAKSFSGTQASNNSGSNAVHIDTNTANDAWCSTVPAGATIVAAGIGTFTVTNVATPTSPGNFSNNWWFTVSPNTSPFPSGTNMTFTWTV